MKNAISIEEARKIVKTADLINAAIEAEKRAAKYYGKLAKKANVTETTKNGKYTRAEAFADAVKAGAGKKDEIIRLSASLYAEKTGNAVNEKEAAWYANTVLPGLIALGLADVKDGVFSIFLPVSKAA